MSALAGALGALRIARLAGLAVDSRAARMEGRGASNLYDFARGERCHPHFSLQTDIRPPAEQIVTIRRRHHAPKVR